MAQSEILEDLFFIERGYLNGNHFVHRSEEPVLIDSGYISDFDETARLITGLGVKLAKICLIISTHCHCDHIGGNKIIQEQSSCDIAVHKIGKYFIDTQDDWATWWKYYNQQAEFFDCQTGIEDADIINIGPHCFEVIHTPGHSADGIVLYNREEKLLISSDTLWENDMAVLTIRVDGHAAVFHMKKSLEKLATLDVNTVYPGHGKQFTDFKGALERSIDRINTYMRDREKIGLDVLKKITVYTLLMKKEVPSDNFFQMLMDTQWFRETVDLYFDAEYETQYNEIMNQLISKGVIQQKNNTFHTTVKP
jgi:glyoxylase-like metal-dependent hydrolase (beta-lactamase superfamily II)